MATNKVTVTQDPTQTNNPLYSGTINIGDNIGLASKPMSSNLKALQEQMIKGNTSPTVVSNLNTPSKVNDIITKTETLTGTSLKNPVKQTIPTTQETQIKDYTNTPYTQDNSGQKYFFNEQTKAYDIPDVGADTGLYGGDPYLLANTKRINDAIKKNDTALASALEGIKNRFQGYRDTQKKITESGAAAARNALLQTEGNRGSVAQFAAATSEGRVNAIMEEGNQALQDLDNKEQELIVATNQAYQTENFKYLNQLNSQIEKLRQEKLEKTKKINEQLEKENIKARENEIKSSRDDAVADLFSQGVTDPLKMLDFLNFDEQGNKIGDFTLKEISDSLKTLVPEGLNDLIQTAKDNFAPDSVIKDIMSSSSINQAYEKAGRYASGGTGIIGEYNRYKNDAIDRNLAPVSFQEYQALKKNDFKSVGEGEQTRMQRLVSEVGKENANSALNITTQYNNDLIVKKYRALQDAVKAINAVSSGSKNPADHQALVYNFAKALDPDSVVREGEYETIKKYSQGLAERYKGELNQAINATGFLSKNAIENIQTAMNNRLKPTEETYQDIKNNYQERVKLYTSDPEIMDIIVPDYSTKKDVGEILIRNEEHADTLFKQIVEKNTPEIQQEISNRYNDLQEILGRPPTASEYFQANPWDKPKSEPQSVSLNTGETNPTKGIVGGINLKGYAVDPNQIKAVATIYNKVPGNANILDYDMYIKSVAPQSKIKGRDILEVATKYQLDPKVLTALIQHESRMGTSSVALANNNFGGITWSPTYQQRYPNVSKGTPRPANEGGYYVKFPSPQAGLMAQAELLNKRKIS